MAGFCADRTKTTQDCKTLHSINPCVSIWTSCRTGHLRAQHTHQPSGFCVVCLTSSSRSAAKPPPRQEARHRPYLGRATSVSSSSRTERMSGMPFGPGLGRVQEGSGKAHIQQGGFGSILKRMGVKPDKSYSDRSAVSTKSSASASLVSGGRGLGWVFIMPDLLVARATDTGERPSTLCASMSLLSWFYTLRPRPGPASEARCILPMY